MKHKWSKRVKASEEKKVFDLLAGGSGVPAIVRESGICRSKVYQLKKVYLAKKESDSFPQMRCTEGAHDYKPEEIFLNGVSWTRYMCRFCGAEEDLGIKSNSYGLIG